MSALEQFNAINFRTLPEEMPAAIRTDDGMTLISVKLCGTARYGRTRADKDAIIAAHAPDDLLLLAWTGAYRTDIFRLTEQDIAKHYRKPSGVA
jgi:hypothetical protein